MFNSIRVQNEDVNDQLRNAKNELC